jgi:hypothetical protein
MSSTLYVIILRTINDDCTSATLCMTCNKEDMVGGAGAHSVNHAVLMLDGEGARIQVRNPKLSLWMLRGFMAATYRHCSLDTFL